MTEIFFLSRALLNTAAAAAPKATSRWPGLALAMFGAVAFSGKAIIVKLAYRYGVDAVTLIMLRMLFALPFFVALAWWAGRPGAAAPKSAGAAPRPAGPPARAGPGP